MMRFDSLKVHAALSLALLLAACGGKVFVDLPGSAGGGGSGGFPSTSTGPMLPCSINDDCPGGGLCSFVTGTCIAPCSAEGCDTCGSGMVCNPCAASSCPECDDCLSGCLPIQPGQCDDDDGCSGGQVCIFNEHQCAPACQSDIDCGGFSFCADCVTGSCCGCENCVSACVGGE